MEAKNLLNAFSKFRKEKKNSEPRCETEMKNETFQDKNKKPFFERGCRCLCIPLRSETTTKESENFARFCKESEYGKIEPVRQKIVDGLQISDGDILDVFATRTAVHISVPKEKASSFLKEIPDFEQCRDRKDRHSGWPEEDLCYNFLFQASNIPSEADFDTLLDELSTEISQFFPTKPEIKKSSFFQTKAQKSSKEQDRKFFLL